jgi:hypothetical protein
MIGTDKWFIWDRLFLLFLKIWGVTPLHNPRNVRPRLWYTFLVCMGMSISLQDFVSQKWNSFRQLFEQNCIEKQVFNGTFTFKKSNCEKKIIVEEDWVSKLNWRLSIYYRLPVVEKCLEISLNNVCKWLHLFHGAWFREFFALSTRTKLLI